MSELPKRNKNNIVGSGGVGEKKEEKNYPSFVNKKTERVNDTELYAYDVKHVM